jgi:2-hydroxy-6-oxonona-2,4-dienedioate hydrolase
MFEPAPMSIGIDSPRCFVELEGVRTAYYRAGTGPTVLLLHGGAPGACSDLHWFRNFGALVAAGYEVVAFDQPGFGYSGAPPDWSLEFRYRHALAVLRWLGRKPVYLIGNSIGGLLATLLAHRLEADPGLSVDGVVLVAPTVHFERGERAREKSRQHGQRLAGVQQNFESVQALCRNTFHNADRASDELVRLRLRMLEGDNWLAYRKRTEAGNDFTPGSVRDAPLKVPALVVWGLNDASVPAELGIAAIEHFANAQFLFLPHCGHWPQTEHPPAFNRAALGFLQSRTTRDGLYKEC